jgi:tripartite-type tricarboxylate transporter receptor subunit TctC
MIETTGGRMRILSAIVLGLVSFGVVHAQSYPTKPIRFIVPDAPGGSADLRARQIAPKLAEALAQAVVIDNKPGGNMIIGAEAAAKSPNDGYTIFLGNIVTFSLNPLMFKTLPYRPDEDFVAITAITAAPLILAVGSNVGATTMRELIDLAKKKPGSIGYGGLSRGGPQHLLMEQISSASGATFMLVPYKSTGTSIQDVLGGHLPIALNYWSIVGPHVKSEKLKALAVAGSRRLAVAPDVPTLAEAGLPGIEGGAWQGVFVPAGTPSAIIARLHRELARIMTLPEIRNPIVETGAEPGGNSPQEFAAFVRADRAKWKKVAEQANLTPE